MHYCNIMKKRNSTPYCRPAKISSKESEIYLRNQPEHHMLILSYINIFVQLVDKFPELNVLLIFQMSSKCH
jgi:hypothetical protein